MDEIINYVQTWYQQYQQQIGARNLGLFAGPRGSDATSAADSHTSNLNMNDQP